MELKITVVAKNEKQRRLYLSQGYTETEPDVFINTTYKTYSDTVVALVRTKYSVNDEIAVLRQRDTKQEEFLEYTNFVEECKNTARPLFPETIQEVTE